MIALMLALAFVGQDASPMDKASQAMGACIVAEGEKLAPREGATPQIAEQVLQACAAQEGEVMALVRKSGGPNATEAEAAAVLGGVHASMLKLATEVVTAERKPPN